MGNLVIAVELIRSDPKLLAGWRIAAKSTTGEVLGNTSSVTALVNQDMVASMENTLRELQACKAAQDQLEEDQDVEIYESSRRTRERRRLSPTEILQRSSFHKRLQESIENRPGGAAMMATRRALPMHDYRQRILDQVKDNAYSIVIGATGSGKTTQVPQIILEDAISRGEGGSCDVICTQPRRIAATSVAQRVAAERLERLQNTVGYQVRFDAKLPIRK